MTSILTNFSAISALQTLRTINSEMSGTQQRISSGLRIETAADNAAYWSIATTMRSDDKTLSAVSDALGLAAATADVAYTGMEAVIDVLGDFSAKLVASKQPGVDTAKIQAELDQYKQSILSIAQSASFAGQNWLNTDIEDIYDDDLTRTSMMGSIARQASGGIAAQTIDFYRSEVSLFNSTGGGLLQPDVREVWTLGGIRSYSSTEPDWSDFTVYNSVDVDNGWMYPRSWGGSVGSFGFSFPDGSPLDFTTTGAEISFDIILDKEASNPGNLTGTSGDLQELPGPYSSGYSKSITITKAEVDAYNAALGGVISTNTQFAGLLNSVLSTEGAYVFANYRMVNPANSSQLIHNPVAMSIQTLENHGPGSYVEIANVTSTGVSTGGLVNNHDWGSRGSGMELYFDPFIVHKEGDDEDGIQIRFNFSINNQTATSHSFNRTYVNELLGKDTGKVETPEEMALLLHSLLDADWPDLIIEATANGTVLIKSDPAADRLWGSGSTIAFDQIRVSIEPLPVLNFLDIDIDASPERTDEYIAYVDAATQRIVDGTATLGALRARIDRQADFIETLMDTTEKGIGRLVDADMEEESTRLKALEVQQQLGIQTLQIANAEPQALMQLFN